MLRTVLFYVFSGILCIPLFYSGLMGKKILFITDARTAVIILTFIGFMMCSFGAISLFVKKAPVHPLTIAGYILGIMALFIGIIQIFKIKIYFFGEPGKALVCIAIIILLKVIISRLYFLLPIQ
jgi:hypothetical protein